MEAPKKMFKRVGLSEKKVLFRGLPQRKTLLLIKGDEEYIYKIVPVKFVDNKFLTCAYIKDEDQRMKVSQPIIINFQVDEDRYFFQSQGRPSGDFIDVDLTTDLFILQRRKTPRVELPGDYPNSMTITELNNKTIYLHGAILDFSAGGAKLTMDCVDPHLKAGDEIRVVMHLNKRNPLSMYCVVKHQARKPEEFDKPQIFGVQFSGMNSVMENKMLNLFMDIQRELFLKFTR